MSTSSPARFDGRQNPRRKLPPKKPAAAKTAAAPKAGGQNCSAKESSCSESGSLARPDNLRRLIGIGPVNERLLKGQGVSTYAQIAAWTEADVKRIEEVLNFDGRIARRKNGSSRRKLLAAGNETEFARQFSDSWHRQQHLSKVSLSRAALATGAAFLFFLGHSQLCAARRPLPRLRLAEPPI